MDSIEKARLYAPHSEDGELLLELAGELEQARNGTPITGREDWENLPVGSLVSIEHEQPTPQGRGTGTLHVTRVSREGIIGSGGCCVAGGQAWNAVWDLQKKATLLHRLPVQEEQAPTLEAAA